MLTFCAGPPSLSSHSLTTCPRQQHTRPDHVLTSTPAPATGLWCRAFVPRRSEDPKPCLSPQYPQSWTLWRLLKRGFCDRRRPGSQTSQHPQRNAELRPRSLELPLKFSQPIHVSDPLVGRYSRPAGTLHRILDFIAADCETAVWGLDPTTSRFGFPRRFRSPPSFTRFRQLTSNPHRPLLRLPLQN